MTEEREPEPGLHGQHLLGAILNVKTDGQELLRGARAATAWGDLGAARVGVGRVTHTYCIFCGSVPRHKALGKQKGCLQWEGVRQEVTVAFEFPRQDPTGDKQSPKLRTLGPLCCLPHPLCNFGCGSLGSDGT